MILEFPYCGAKGPAVEQLYQMPQMARHCSGPREERTEIESIFSPTLSLFCCLKKVPLKLCEEKFTNDLLSTIKLPKNAIDARQRTPWEGWESRGFERLFAKTAVPVGSAGCLTRVGALRRQPWATTNGTKPRPKAKSFVLQTKAFHNSTVEGTAAALSERWEPCYN